MTNKNKDLTQKLKQLEKNIFSTKEKLKNLESGYKLYLKKKIPEICEEYKISPRQAYRYLLEEKEIIEYAIDFCTMNRVRTDILTEKQKYDQITDSLIEGVKNQEYVKYRIKNSSRKDYLNKKLEILVEIEDYESAQRVKNQIEKLNKNLNSEIGY